MYIKEIKELYIVRMFHMAMLTLTMNTESHHTVILGFYEVSVNIMMASYMGANFENLKALYFG